jgi:hypothetical protein
MNAMSMSSLLHVLVCQLKASWRRFKFKRLRRSVARHGFDPGMSKRLKPSQRRSVFGLRQEPGAIGRKAAGSRQASSGFGSVIDGDGLISASMLSVVGRLWRVSADLFAIEMVTCVSPQRSHE